MKIFKFFIGKIFLRKATLCISMVLILLMANYTTFIAARSILSTYQGYQEIKCMDKNGIYIANMDPDSDIDMNIIGENELKNVYNYLNENFNYALYTDGFMVSIPNEHDMEISLTYMNEGYNDLNKLELSQGMELNFDYKLGENKEIPVLIGKGLSKTYPIGSTIEIIEPVLGQSIVFKVQGILKQNAYHSNFYALNSKNYYNFSIVVPINEEFIENANIDLKLNGLMDIAILQATEEKVVDLCKVMYDNLGLKFNFFSQKENFDYFTEYYMYSLKIISITTAVLLVVITCISIWNALVSIRLMLKDFMINLLVGLSYTRLRKVFYGYFGILFLFNLICIYSFTAYNRWDSWLRKDSTFVTYGRLGLIGMDWLAILVVILSDIFIGILIVEIMLRRIKKIPISLGVLQ